MKSRGYVFGVGAGARKSLVLFWTAVFLCSLMLQSVAAPALAVHNEGLFELDGNVENQAAAGDDWNAVFNGNDDAIETVFVNDPVNGNGDKYFDQGGSKDISDIPNWLWTNVSQPQDKNDIAHAYASAYRSTEDHLLVYFGLDRYASNGAAQVGFWFLQDDNFGVNDNKTFGGQHEVGDVLVQIEFENGGANPVLRVYKWTANGLSQINLANLSDAGTAVAATASTNPDWSFDDKGAQGASNDIPAGGMVEGGIDLTELGLDKGCFASFLAETRSSPSEDSTLSDFALGSFALCAKPKIETHVRQAGTGEVSTINKGESVFDRAILTGDRGTVDGKVKFFVCRDANAEPDCSTGGDQVGGAVDLVDGKADSAEFTPTQLGFYCFRVEYTPAANSKYLADSHTNKTTECFQVIPAEIELVKVRDAASVSAGDPIGFTLTVTSKGPGSAFGVKVTDTLPTNAGLAWSIDAAGTTGTWVIESGVLKFGGADGVTLAKNATFHVHITSPTTKATCGQVDNTGNATTTNDGTDTDSASVTVLCPDVKVTKDPNDGHINAGETATFTIKVENIGQGTAKGVVLTDPLPSGLTWSESYTECTITSGTLSCTVGDLAPGASKTYTVTAPTTKDNCGVINNTGSATATNEPNGVLDNNADSGKITVDCAAIDIAKEADAAVVNAGDQIGFTITVKNNGAGTAFGVSASDTLNPAFTWSLVPSTGWTLVGNQLTYTAASLASGASSSAHVTAPTTAANCGTVPNTATVTTTNDGGDEDSASTKIECPDVTVLKKAVTTPVTAGDPIAFDITVTNLGPGLARSVTLTDTLPAGITWSENSTSCSITAGVLSCTFGDLAKDASATVRVSGTTSSANCGNVPNTATVAASNEAAANTGNNSSNDTVVVNCPDVKIEKDPVATPINAGDDAAFTIKVTNLGPGTATGVTVSDTLPAGVSWSENSDACSITSGVLSCSFGTLAQGASASVSVSGKTDAADCGTIPNTASVAATNEDPTKLGNNQDSASIVVNCPDIKVTKDADNSPISAGQAASYTIKVENIGVGAAYGVTLTDTLPAGITWTENSDACSITTGVLSCDFGTILPGGSRTVTVSGETTAANCGSLPNTASASATNEPSNVLGNNQDGATITVECPQIVITKSTVTPVVNAGDDISFDVVVTNTGAGTAFNVAVTDTLPVVPGVSWSIDAGNTTGTWTIEAGVLKFGPANLAKDASVKVRIVSDTTPASCQTIPNLANLTYSGGSGSDDSSIVVECPDVTISKTADNSPINAGETASFTISVWNEGPGTAYDVEIKDTLPLGLTWTENSDACSIAAGVLTCQVGDLEDDADPFSVVVSAATSSANCGNLPNLGKVSAANEPDGKTGNNEDSDTVVVLCAAIGIDKTADDGVVNAGDKIGFSITVSNGGPGTAKGVSATDTLDPAFTWTLDPSTGWALDGNKLAYTAEQLLEGGSSTAHVWAWSTAADCRKVDNTAFVDTDNDGEDSSSASVVIECPDVVIDKTADNSPIVAGETASFTISVWNEGPGTAYDVELSDELPAGVAWTESSADCGIDDVQGVLVLTCDVGTLTPEDEPFTVTVHGPTDAADCGDLDNLATTSASNEPEGNLENNKDDASIEVQCASISLVKTAGDAEDGDELVLDTFGNVTFTYVVTNAGTADLVNVHLVDDNATPGNTADDVVVTCPSTSLAAGASMNCTVTLPVSDFGVRTNWAVVTANPEPNPEQEVTDKDDAVVRIPEPVATPTPRITPPPTSTLGNTEVQVGTGTGLLLVLFSLAGIVLALGYLVPSPARARRRNRKG
jgi:uncharacterized repeat protein (TIGR01451 family)